MVVSVRDYPILGGAVFRGQRSYSGLVAFSLLVPMRALVSQDYCKRQHPPISGLTFGTVKSPDAATVDTLRMILRTCGLDAWRQVRVRYFGESYTPQLPDWIVYVSADGAKQTIIQNDREVKNRLLRGEKYVYFVVFLEHGLTTLKGDINPKGNMASSGVTPPGRTPSSGIDTLITEAIDALLGTENLHRLVALRDTLVFRKVPSPPVVPDSLQIRGEVIQFQPPPFLVRLITGFGSKIFGAATSVSAESQTTDTTISVALVDLGRGKADTGHLYLAFGKVRALEDAWGRITVMARPGMHLPGSAYQVLTNYINTSRSKFGFSLGIGATLNARTSSFVRDSEGLGTLDPTDATRLLKKQQGQWVALNFYLVGHYELVRRSPRPLLHRLLPALALPYESLDLVLGTNIAGKGDLFDDVITGVSFSGILGGDNGFTVGVDWRATQRGDVSTRQITEARIPRPYVGLEFPL